MASKEEKELNEQVMIALNEIGEIIPWFSKEFDAWIFSSPLYPVEYAGDSPDDVIKQFPLYIKEFIKHRVEGNLSPHMETKTHGRGGKRSGAGRPKGHKEEKVRVYLPKDIAALLKEPGALTYIRGLIKVCHHVHI